MQFQFVLPKGYEMRELMNLNRVVVKRKLWSRILVPVLRIALFFVGAFLFLSGLFLIIMDSDAAIATSIVLMIVGILWMFLGVFYYRYGAWRSKSLTLKNIGTITVTLDEEVILEQTAKGMSKFDYDMICEAICYRDTYFLFLDKKHALVMPKRYISVGNSEAFDAFWDRKCEKKLRKL